MFKYPRPSNGTVFCDMSDNKDRYVQTFCQAHQFKSNGTHLCHRTRCRGRFFGVEGLYGVYDDEFIILDCLFLKVQNLDLSLVANRDCHDLLQVCWTAVLFVLQILLLRHRALFFQLAQGYLLF